MSKNNMFNQKLEQIGGENIVDGNQKKKAIRLLFCHHLLMLLICFLKQIHIHLILW